MGGINLTLAFMQITMSCIWITLWELVPTLKRIADALEQANKINKGDKL